MAVKRIIILGVGLGIVFGVLFAATAALLRERGNLKETLNEISGREAVLAYSLDECDVEREVFRRALDETIEPSGNNLWIDYARKVGIEPKEVK